MRRFWFRDKLGELLAPQIVGGVCIGLREDPKHATGYRFVVAIWNRFASVGRLFSVWFILYSQVLIFVYTIFYSVLYCFLVTAI